MGKARVLHSKLKVDEAGKSHRCQHNRNHIISKGDRRLKVTEGRTDEHYCLSCAARFLAGTIASLQELLLQVNQAMQPVPVDSQDLSALPRQPSPVTEEV